MRTRPILTGPRRATIVVLLAVLAWTAFPGAAHAATLVVKPGQLQGWQLQTTGDAVPPPGPSVSFVYGPATPPLGMGSVRLAVGADGNDAAQIRYPGYAGILVSDLTALSYSTYATGGSGGQAPYIILQVDTDGDAGVEDLWFFEPVYQSATFFPSNPQAPLVENTWQTWDALNGGWYSVFGTAGSGPGTNVVPLATLIAASPNATIINSSPSGLGGLRFVVGFGAGPFDNHVGHVDNVHVASVGTDITFDFEPVPVSRPAVVNLSTNWHLRDTLTTGPADVPPFSYDVRPVVPIMGDWDGNGTRTVGTYKAGEFSLNNANDGSGPDIAFAFGDPRGFPVVGDYNGDGTEDVAVYRNGLWQVRLSTGATFEFNYGTGTWPATIPVAGDWNGDGTDGIGTYTYNSGTWSLRQSATAGAADAGSFVFGTPNSSYPVPGDWNADGTDTVGVKTGTTWSLRNSNTPGPPEITFDFGGANDLPLTWWAPGS